MIIIYVSGEILKRLFLNNNFFNEYKKLLILLFKLSRKSESIKLLSKTISFDLPYFLLLFQIQEVLYYF